MTEEQKRPEAGETLRDGVRAVFGVVGALKDAIEETFQDLLDRGELSPERAREAAKSTVKKAQDTVEEMRDRLDFVSRREFDLLREEIAELRRLVEQRSAGATQATAPAPVEPAQPPPPASTPREPPPTTDEDRPRFTIDDA